MANKSRRNQYGELDRVLNEVQGAEESRRAGSHASVRAKRKMYRTIVNVTDTSYCLLTPKPNETIIQTSLKNKPHPQIAGRRSE